MAYLPGLANDIFISYAHADNSEGWVDQFHERLLNRLRQLDRSAPFTIWRDRKLTGVDVFTDEIYRQLESSGILISILSPNGLDSNWCQQERERQFTPRMADDRFTRRQPENLRVTPERTAPALQAQFIQL